MIKNALLSIVGIFLLSNIGVADNLSVAKKAEKVGMSSQRLTHIDRLMQTYVDDGELVGAVTMIARHGKVVQFEKYGTLNMDTGAAMEKDSIFRIYSMSKPITSVAAMMLYEQGKFQLTDPVEKYLPELTGMQVLEDGNRLPQQKPFTIQQLMSHTAGLSYGFSNHPVDKLIREQRILRAKDLSTMVSQLSEIPLVTQPGTAWRYSVSTDVLGRLVEVVAGQPLDQFVSENIFQPLMMEDTFFEVPKTKLARFGTNHRFDRSSQKLIVTDKPQTSIFANNVTLFSGGGGLLSTAADYMRFCQMLLNGGELDGKRILGAKTIKYMTQNHIGSLSASLTGEGATNRPGQAFGLGFGIVIDPTAAGVMSSAGEYNWGGAAGTLFWIDPVEDLIAIVMIQHQNVRIPLRNTFKTLTYAAIVD